MRGNSPILIFLGLLFFNLFFGAFNSTTQGASTIDTFFLPDISITPNPVVLGQQITIIKNIWPEPPTGYSYQEIIFTIFDSNDNYREIGRNSTQPETGRFYYSWTPDISGDFLFIFTYPGETIAENTYTSCQSNNSITIYSSLPTATSTPSPFTTPSPVPIPIPTPTSTSTPTANPTTSININCQSSTTYSNLIVNIQGTLRAKNSGLADSLIQLSYSADSGKSWTPLTTLKTDDTGTFQTVWTISETGDYFLRATYEGNLDLPPASTTVHFAFLPVEDDSCFSIASNSTVKALTFNSTCKELCFEVSGEKGTIGYIEAIIPKNLLKEGNSIKAYIDGEQVEYEISSTENSWICFFNYSHSTHQITLKLITEQTNQPQLSNEIILVGILVIFGLILAFEAFLFRNKK